MNKLSLENFNDTLQNCIDKRNLTPLKSYVKKCIGNRQKPKNDVTINIQEFIKNKFYNVDEGAILITYSKLLRLTHSVSSVDARNKASILFGHFYNNYVRKEDQEPLFIKQGIVIYSQIMCNDLDEHVISLCNIIKKFDLLHGYLKEYLVAREAIEKEAQFVYERVNSSEGKIYTSLESLKEYESFKSGSKYDYREMVVLLTFIYFIQFEGSNLSPHVLPVMDIVSESKRPLLKKMSNILRYIGFLALMNEKISELIVDVHKQYIQFYKESLFTNPLSANLFKSLIEVIRYLLSSHQFTPDHVCCLFDLNVKEVVDAMEQIPIEVEGHSLPFQSVISDCIYHILGSVNYLTENSTQKLEEVVSTIYNNKDIESLEELFLEQIKLEKAQKSENVDPLEFCYDILLELGPQDWEVLMMFAKNKLDLDNPMDHFGSNILSSPILSENFKNFIEVKGEKATFKEEFDYTYQVDNYTMGSSKPVDGRVLRWFSSSFTAEDFDVYENSSLNFDTIKRYHNFAWCLNKVLFHYGFESEYYNEQYDRFDRQYSLPLQVIDKITGEKNVRVATVTVSSDDGYIYHRYLAHPKTSQGQDVDSMIHQASYNELEYPVLGTKSMISKKRSKNKNLDWSDGSNISIDPENKNIFYVDDPKNSYQYKIAVLPFLK